MTAGRYDLTIEKKAKFYQEFQILLDSGLPKSLEGKTIKCQIKDSTETSTVIHDLTVDNGGVVMIDDTIASFALYISAQDTDVNYDFGFYDIVEINTEYPDEETERVLQGRINYIEGVTI